MLSIVIPSYNSSKTIGHLLSSISSSRRVQFKDVEVIIVDDASLDASASFIQTNLSDWTNLTNFKLIKLRKNHGPAFARNIGVKYAKGEVVLFLDSDVVLFPDTLREVISSFKNDPDLFAMTGVWDKKQYRDGFFPEFKALRDWSYWINERDPRNYYYLFSTRVAAIKRDLFVRLGGFDTTYKSALVEDIELTYRIAKRYAVVFNPNVIVHHEFEDFFPVAKKYFWRSYFWSKIYRERKKFDPVATTGKEALAAVSAGLLTYLSAGFLLSYFGTVIHLSDLSPVTDLLGSLLVIAFGVHFLTVRKFIFFCVREKGIWFGARAFITGIVLYLVILGGAMWSYLFSVGKIHAKIHL